MGKTGSKPIYIWVQQKPNDYKYHYLYYDLCTEHVMMYPTSEKTYMHYCQTILHGICR